MSSDRVSLLFSLCLISFLVSGCGTVNEKSKIDYKSSGAGSQISPLEIPPQVGVITTSDRYVIPGTDTTTFSRYSAANNNQESHSITQLLPDVPGVTVGREGAYRWLIVEESVNDIWPVVSEFWMSQGFLIKRLEPEVGIVETDWAENVSQVDIGAIRSLIREYLPGAYANPERDRFITRLDRVSEDVTEIHLSHESAAKIATREGRNLDVAWQSRPRNPNTEARMLRRLMLFLGVEEGGLPDSILDEPKPLSKLTQLDESEGAIGLIVDSPADVVWEKVKLVLLNIGASVESLDETSKVFIVRYRDPDGKVEKKGLEKLKFWKDDDVVETLVYQIVVNVTEDGSMIRVRAENGSEVSTDTAKRILTVLQERLG